MKQLQADLERAAAEYAASDSQLKGKLSAMESELTRVRLVNHRMREEQKGHMAQATAHEFLIADLFDKHNMEHLMGTLWLIVAHPAWSISSWQK